LLRLYLVYDWDCECDGDWDCVNDWFVVDGDCGCVNDWFVVEWLICCWDGIVFEFVINKDGVITKDGVAWMLKVEIVWPDHINRI